MIRARDLAYRIGGRTVLEVPELDIPAQGITTILGPNGAGKSVMLRLLHGILAPDTGTVIFPSRAEPPRQTMVFQKPVLLRRTVAANVAFALSAACKNRNDAVTHLQRGGMDGMAWQPARTLSGGEQQKLAMIRALATEPELIFLDEPTASLDPAATLAIEQMILEADRAGTKIIMVTHNIAQARRIASDIVFCHAGRVVETGPAEAVLSRPSSPEAADYLAGKLRA